MPSRVEARPVLEKDGVQGYRLFALEEQQSSTPCDCCSATADHTHPAPRSIAPPVGFQAADDGGTRGTNGPTVPSPRSRKRKVTEPEGRGARADTGTPRTLEPDQRMAASGSVTPRKRKPKPPKAIPRTKCVLCGRVGAFDTFIYSRFTDSHYCADFAKCDRRRGEYGSRKTR